MEQLSIQEAQERFFELMERVEAGEEFIILSNNGDMLKLCPHQEANAENE